MRTRLPGMSLRYATMAALATAAAAQLLPSTAAGQQWDGINSAAVPVVTKAPTAPQSAAPPSFDAKFTAALMSNNIFRGYTLSNNLPSASGTLEAIFDRVRQPQWRVGTNSGAVPFSTDRYDWAASGIRKTDGRNGLGILQLSGKRRGFVLCGGLFRAELRGHAEAHAWRQHLLWAELLPLGRVGKLQCGQR